MGGWNLDCRLMSILGSQAIVGACISAPADANWFHSADKKLTGAGGRLSLFTSDYYPDAETPLLSPLPITSFSCVSIPFIFDFSDPFFCSSFYSSVYAHTKCQEHEKIIVYTAKNAGKKTTNSVATKEKVFTIIKKSERVYIKVE